MNPENSMITRWNPIGSFDEDWNIIDFVIEWCSLGKWILNQLNCSESNFSILQTYFIRMIRSKIDLKRIQIRWSVSMRHPSVCQIISWYLQLSIYCFQFSHNTQNVNTQLIKTTHHRWTPSAWNSTVTVFSPGFNETLTDLLESLTDGRDALTVPDTCAAASSTAVTFTFHRFLPLVGGSVTTITSLMTAVSNAWRKMFFQIPAGWVSEQSFNSMEYIKFIECLKSLPSFDQVIILNNRITRCCDYRKGWTPIPRERTLFLSEHVHMTETILNRIGTIGRNSILWHGRVDLWSVESLSNCTQEGDRNLIISICWCQNLEIHS